ncbi:hypothetical protein Cflav_PD5261 [Pedosphaera parvula Ellin514]|uniref:Uncharacterized protein n=1 Tax=Pedosphaera parvula (strain Ellin514) TaxID=320771 RepID=B9XCF8_PEDPL|nr:hypothetical protein Cflav_PD5261 [Pedosphaera parvula Ellin514]
MIEKYEFCGGQEMEKVAINLRSLISEKGDLPVRKDGVGKEPPAPLHGYGQS